MTLNPKKNAHVAEDLMLGDFWYNLTQSQEFVPEDVLGDEEELNKIYEAIDLLVELEELYNRFVEEREVKEDEWVCISHQGTGKAGCGTFAGVWKHRSKGLGKSNFQFHLCLWCCDCTYK